MAIGASAAGARTYTATSSQGLLFMAEAVYNAAGLGLPIVMTIGNRAIGAPINIWNDHSDSMSMRDAGWIQLFAETNQEALDLHIQAFRLAEELSCPVMVCMDGFILTHAYDRVDIPTQEQVDAYLPPFEPRQILDPADPVSIGAMVGPEAFTEVRYLQHHKQLRALDAHSAARRGIHRQFGRNSGGLLRTYRTEDADTIVVSLGSVNGTCRKSSTRCATKAHAIGSVSICSFRPFPLAALREALPREARRRAGEVPRRRPRRHRLGRRAQVAVRHPAQGLHGDRRTGRTRDHAGVAAPAVRGRDRRRAGAGDVPRPQRRGREPRARARKRGAAHRPDGGGDPAPLGTVASHIG